MAQASVPRAALAFLFAGVMAVSLAACGDGGEGAVDPTGEAAAVGEPSETEATQETTAASDVADAEADDSSGLPDACALLSPTEIESATGIPVDEGVADADRQTEYSALCEWTQTGDRGFVAIAVAPGYPVPYEAGESAVGTAVAIDIPGASEAFSISEGRSVGMRVDGDYIALSFAGATEGAQVDVTIALATLVASRYGG